MKLQRHCPICGCGIGELLHRVEFAKGKKEFIPSEYGIVSCLSCGFVFNDTAWRQADYNRYYSATSKYTGKDTLTAGGLSDYEISRYGWQIDRFKNYIPSLEASIADIGCAKGGFLRTLQNFGYQKLFGIEPSAECCSFLGEMGIEGIEAALPDLGGVGQKFDVVLLSHVAEHVCDLRSMVNSLSRVVNDGGLLYVEVPNALGYGKFLASPFYYFDLEHINHFSKEYLEILFEENFECVHSSDSEESPYNVCYCVLKKKSCPSKRTLRSPAGYSDHISAYLLKSLDANALTYQRVSDLALRGGVFLWGGGAYLRAQLERGILEPLKENIKGIIDKNKSLHGEAIHSDFMGMDIEVFAPNALENCSAEDAVFITGVLYQRQIYDELTNSGFKGKIFNLCE